MRTADRLGSPFFPQPNSPRLQTGQTVVYYDPEINSEVRIVPPKGTKTVALNRKARHDYFVESTLEAGIELRGTEVKSMRMGQMNLKDSYASVDKDELWVYGMHVSPYEKGSFSNTDPMRPKKLLVHRYEILKLEQQVMKKGLTLVPLSVYLKDGRMKVELGVCRGKKSFDKRDSIAERDVKREIARTMRERNR